MGRGVPGADADGVLAGGCPVSGVLAFSFPNPFSLMTAVVSPVLNLVTDAAGDALGGVVETVIRGLAGAVVGAVVDLTASVLSFFWDAAEPELTSSWFYGGQETPYQEMVLLAMPLLVAFFFAGVIQGALRGDTGGMLRMALLRLPGAVLAMSTVVVLADVLLDVTDEMSAALLDGFRDDVEQVGTILGSVAVSGNLPAQMLVLVFAGVGLLAAVVLIIELFVQAALLYLLAAFSPLIYAAAVWEPMRGSLRKLGEVALALIVSKLAIAAALAVSAAALVAAWPGAGAEAVTALPTPEQAALQADQSVAQTVGILVSAIVMWCVAAFMPFVLWRLLPLAESAMVAQGIRGAPGRGVFMAGSAASMAAHNPAVLALRARAGKGQQAGTTGGAASPATAAHPATAAAAAGAPAAKAAGRKLKDTTAAAADRQSTTGTEGDRRRASGSSGSGGGRGGRASGSSAGGASGSGRGGGGRPLGPADRSTGAPRPPGASGAGSTAGGSASAASEQPARPSQRSQPRHRGGRGGGPARGSRPGGSGGS